nr:STM4015 family protein [Planobispora longispora]
MPGEADTEIPAAGETAWRIARDVFDREESFERRFIRLLEKADASAIKAIIAGMWHVHGESSAEVVGLLVDNAHRLPELRSIFLGAMTSEECEISWIEQSDVTPLLEAFPLLERLEVRGGSGLRLRPVRHEALKVLRLESGACPRGGAGVGACDLPALEYLELWLGVSDYGGDATVEDLEPILSGERLPSLRHLGLQDSEIQDEIAAAVAVAPVVARLEGLALSMGTLGDAGAEALLSGQPLTHLKRLDLHCHYLSDAMMERLGNALPGADLSQQADLARTGGERYVAVSE